MNTTFIKIVNAIIRQEGMSPTFTNPGNLRSAPWRNSPNIVNHFWKPATRAEGVAGLAHVVMLRIAEGQTLRQLITAWAPPSDGNDTDAYIRDVQAWAEIANADVPLWNYILPAPASPAQAPAPTSTT